MTSMRSDDHVGDAIWSPSTRRGFLSAAGVLAAGGLVSACGGGSTTSAGSTSGPEAAAAKVDGDLHFFSWADYVPPDVMKSFEQEYGVKIKQTFYATSQEAQAKLSSGQPYDLSFIGSQHIPKLSAAGLLRQVDHSQLENAGELLEFFKDPPYDPGSKHIASSYAIGGVGLAWRKDRLGDLTGSWKDLWDFAGEADGRTFMFDDFQLSLSVALTRLGHPIDSSDPAQLEEAADSIIELKKSSLGGFSPTGIQDILGSGRATLMMAYAGDTRQVLLASKTPETIGFQFNSENLLFNSDNFVLPAAGKAPGTAMLFVDWVLRPDNMKKVVEFIGYPVPTTTGMAEYARIVEDYPELTFDENVVSDSSSWLPTLSGETLDLWNQTWTRVKAS